MVLSRIGVDKMAEHFTRPNIEKVIGKLGTTPEQRGLSTQEFKDKFDEMPEAIQQYIKETLLTELDTFKQDFITHKAENVYEKEVHGLEIEEGIWTPSFYCANVPGNHTLSTATGSYYKIGKLVSLYFNVVVSVFDSSANGIARIGNLPFPAKSHIFPVSFSDLRNIEHPSIPLGSITGSIADATGLSIVISQVQPDGTFRYLNQSFFHDGSVIRGGLTYFTD